MSKLSTLKTGDKITVTYLDGSKCERTFVAFDPNHPNFVIYTNGVRGVYYASICSDVEVTPKKVNITKWVFVDTNGKVSNEFFDTKFLAEAFRQNADETIQEITFEIMV